MKIIINSELFEKISKENSDFPWKPIAIGTGVALGIAGVGVASPFIARHIKSRMLKPKLNQRHISEGRSVLSNKVFQKHLKDLGISDDMIINHKFSDTELSQLGKFMSMGTKT